MARDRLETLTRAEQAYFQRVRANLVDVLQLLNRKAFHFLQNQKDSVGIRNGCKQLFDTISKRPASFRVSSVRGKR